MVCRKTHTRTPLPFYCSLADVELYAEQPAELYAE